jgi:transcription initiation factor IIE alpha subunit
MITEQQYQRLMKEYAKTGAPDTPAAKTGLSTAQIATPVKLTTRSVRTRMGKLVEQGLVTVVGKNERDPQRKYFWRR